MKKLFVAFFTVLVFSMCAGTIYAESDGSCGESVSFVLDINGTLTISGSGAMTNWSSNAEVPWVNENVVSVVIEDGVTSIGDYAFQNMKSVNSLSMPESLTSIGNRSFHSSGLTGDIVIPANVTEIGNYAFNFTSVSGIIFAENSKLTQLKRGAFRENENLNSVTIPSSVTKVAEETSGGSYSIFGNSPNLHTLIFTSESAPVFCPNAFEGAADPLTVYYPDTWKNFDTTQTFGSAGSVNWVVMLTDTISYFFTDNGETLNFVGTGDMPEYTTENCPPYGTEKYTKVIIGEGITSVGNFAFSNTFITSVSMPETLKMIGESNFDSNTLTEVTYGGSGKQWSKIIVDKGNSALQNADISCQKSDLVYDLNGGSCEGETYVAVASGTNVDLNLLPEREGYEFIGWKLKDEFVTSVTVTDDVAVTAQWAVCGYLNDNITWKIYDNTLTISGTGDMPDYMYKETKPYGSTGFTHVIIGEGITSVGDRAFEDSSAETVSFPSALTEIGEYAFFNCKSLNGVTIPDNVTVISKDAFAECSSLTEFTISRNSKLKILDDYGLYNTAVASIYLPETLEKIGIWNFDKTDVLKNVTYGGSKLQWSNISIAGINGSSACNQALKQQDFINFRKCDLIYNLNGGSCLEQTVISVTPGTTITLTLEPEREHYKFTCWTLNGEETDTVIVNEDTTVTAKWELTEVAVKLHIDSNVTIPSGYEAVDNCIIIYCNKGSELLLPEVGKFSYYYDGWQIDGKGEALKSVTPEDDTDMYVLWLSKIILELGNDYLTADLLNNYKYDLYDDYAILYVAPDEEIDLPMVEYGPYGTALEGWRFNYTTGEPFTSYTPERDEILLIPYWKRHMTIGLITGDISLSEEWLALHPHKIYDGYCCCIFFAPGTEITLPVLADREDGAKFLGWVNSFTNTNELYTTYKSSEDDDDFNMVPVWAVDENEIIENGMDKFISAYATVGGRISMIFKIALSNEAVNAGAKVVFSLESGKTVTVPVTEKMKKNGLYEVPLVLTATQMDEIITAAVEYTSPVTYRDGTSGSVITDYSVNSYLNSINKKDNSALSNVINAMLNFSAYSHIYIGDTAPDVTPDADSLNLTDEEKTEISEYKATVTKNGTGVTAKSAFLTIGSLVDITVKFTVSPEKNISDYEFTIDGNAVSPVHLNGDDANVYSVTVSGISPLNYNKKYIFRAAEKENTENSVIVEYSVLDYINYELSATDNSDNAVCNKLVDICKAMYKYGKASEAYNLILSS